MMKPKREYYYRGLVERGGPFKGYRWANGYSANGPNGEETQPWLTKRECYAEAKADGVQAVFINDGGVTK